MIRASDRDLMELAVLTHGPLDMALTLSHWHLETNPLVLSLGQAPWIAVKAVLCVSVMVAFLLTKESDSKAVRACLLFLAILGVGAVVSNLLIISGIA